MEARDGLLGILPNILKAITAVWKAWDPQKLTSAKKLASQVPLAIGDPKVLKNLIDYLQRKLRIFSS